jgi:hypothetical protein
MKAYIEHPSIGINVIFGFVIGLLVFIGPAEVIAYGSKLAGQIIKLTGYGQEMASFGIATTAAPYVVLTPILGLVTRQLSSVRSLKGFGFFALAVIIGFVVTFFSRGYFAGLMG